MVLVFVVYTIEHSLERRCLVTFYYVAKKNVRFFAMRFNEC